MAFNATGGELVVLGPRDSLWVLSGDTLEERANPYVVAGDGAVQALIRWEPMPFLVAEAGRRASAGMTPGTAVFRVSGRPSGSRP